MENYIEKSVNYLKEKVQKREERNKEVANLTSMYNTLMAHYENNKQKETSGDILNDIMEIRSELKFLTEYNEFSEKVIMENAPLFDIKVCDLLEKVGEQLDKKYGDANGYKRIDSAQFDHYENTEYDDFGEYTCYSHTMDAGFKIYHKGGLYKEVMLPAISFGPIDCRLSDNYIFENENVNLLTSGLIGAKSGEFKTSDWQDLFWDIYKENFKYEMNRKLINGEQPHMHDCYSSEFNRMKKTELGE